MQVTNDGHRFRFESLNHDQPKGSLHWDQSFIDLIDLPGYGHQPPPTTILWRRVLTRGRGAGRLRR